MQLSLLISPLGNIQKNIGSFHSAYSCTGDTAVKIGRNASNHLTSEATSVAGSFVDTVHGITNNIRTYVLDPLESLQSVFGGMENAANDMEYSRERCENSTFELSKRCISIDSSIADCKDKYATPFNYVCYFLSRYLLAAMHFIRMKFARELKFYKL